ncbi:MAG: type I phosphomannose isomerase catalytic subunit, partial [Actinomycetota bacterium]|nr:type I phosphomannose isomerase catalytic subunit [Actinomycetota bacterium]
MQLLGKNIQHYHWGDYEYIPTLQGRVSGADPEAELWMGAHPKSPSRALDTNQGLDELIALNPDEALGEHAKDFNGELPYIMKILAIRSPLSLQVHPNEEQASAGFKDEAHLEKETKSY